MNYANKCVNVHLTNTIESRDFIEKSKGIYQMSFDWFRLCLRTRLPNPHVSVQNVVKPTSGQGLQVSY